MELFIRIQTFLAPSLRHGTAALSLLALLLFTGGCIQTRLTDPPRSAVEQLLLSHAADRALAEAAWDRFDGRRVYLDSNYFESYDKPYVLGLIRDLLSSHGALLVRNLNDAEVVIEPRSGALSIDSAESIIGIPSLPFPVPLTGVVETPEIALLKTERQFSVAKLALLSYETDSGRHLYSTGPLEGHSAHKHYHILGLFRITTTEIPEKIPPRRREN